MTSVAAASDDPFIAVFVRIIEDPLRNEMFPNLYPPSADTLKILAVGDITDIEQDKTPANQSATISASENALVSRISGFDAVEYRVGLDSRTFGHRYVRGALVITPTRDISLYVVGSDEPGVSGSVEPRDVDALWDTFVDSLVIDF